MIGDPNPRLPELFAQARALPPTARTAFLLAACGDDAPLRHELEELLAHDASTPAGDHLVDGPPLVPGAAVEAAWRGADRADENPAEDDETPSYPRGSMVGAFRIEGEIGRGGFGVVYLAEQAPPEQRLVALKILEGVALSPRLARRFAEERRAQANMNHPGIARIYSGGTTDAGHPYFAMELVADASGRAPAPSITAWVDQQRLSVRQRVELFLLVCHAVQHAHQQGVIHRDLKPSNILVASGASGAEPKVIDFGIARHLEPVANKTTPQTVLTVSREVFGTPAYMSPEQSAGRPMDLRTDVYSLGVVLYELLCGVLPLALSGSIVDQMLIVRNAEPMRPTTAVRRRTATAGTSSHQATRLLVRELRGDLETILLRALEKDPARRFPTVNALADDLGRFLTHQPIESRPRTLIYTLGKLLRRHRTFAVAIVIVFVALAVTTPVSLVMWDRAQTMAAIANLRAAQYALDAGRGHLVRPALDAVPEDLRGWEWGDLDARSDRSRRAIVDGLDRVAGLAIDPSGKRLLCGDRNGTASVFDRATGKRLGPTVRQEGRAGERDVWSVAWSPDGTQFATGSFAPSVHLCRTDGSQPPLELETTEVLRGLYVYAVAFHPSQPWLVVGAGNTTAFALATFDTRTGALRAVAKEPHRSACNDLAFSPDGKYLATVSDDATVQVWTCSGDHPVPHWGCPVDTSSEAVAWSPDGHLLAVGTHAGEVRLFDWPSGAPRKPWHGHTLPIASVAFHPCGKWLVSGSWDATIRVWSVHDERTVDLLPGHALRVNRVVFESDGMLLSGSNDGTVREWQVPNDNPVRSMQVADTAVTLARFLADGTLAIQTMDGAVHRVDLPGNTITPVGPGGTEFEVTPDGNTIVWRSDSGLRTWRRETGLHNHPRPESLARHFGRVDDSCVVVSDHANVLRFDLHTFAWTPVLPRPRLAADHELRRAIPPTGTAPWTSLWSDDHESARGIGTEIEGLPPGHRPLYDNPTSDHVLLAHGTRDELKVLDLRSGKIVANLAGHGERVTRYAFAPLPDDSRLATIAIGSGGLRVWDWRNEHLVLTLDPPPRDPPVEGKQPHFTAVTWSRDGQTLVTGTSDGRIIQWPGRRPQTR